jgi:hypothetical protein
MPLKYQPNQLSSVPEVLLTKLRFSDLFENTQQVSPLTGSIKRHNCAEYSRLVYHHETPSENHFTISKMRCAQGQKPKAEPPIHSNSNMETLRHQSQLQSKSKPIWDQTTNKKKGTTASLSSNKKSHQRAIVNISSFKEPSAKSTK